LRPGFHFSPKRGWTNDPNGLVEHNGRFHLFFQHNPYGANWGNMHWGHATSRDLVRWEETGEALYPDATGTMFSGSGVVVWDRGTMFPVSDAGTGPLMVLFYTAAGGTGPQSRGQKFTQALAYSADEGRTWRKYHGNPIVEEITGGNRDPKVIWHAPTRQWVMVLYVERNKTHMAAFLTSPNLREWTFRSEVPGFFECPDLFPLSVPGPALVRLWVLTAANSEYMLGTFDGATFTPQTAMLPGHRGKGFYAAQTFADMPDFRRVQIGWLQAPAPGMPFNQCMSLPFELALLETPDGPRLARQPVRELERLRAKSHDAAGIALNPGDANPLESITGELIEVRAEFVPDAKAVVAFDVRGIPVEYDAATQHITVNGHRAPAPLRNGRQRLSIFLDRTVIEVFASDGLTYAPLPVIPDRENRSVRAAVRGGGVRFDSLAAHELSSIWKP
jgi:sucrose-6-phosphate hydrolase SacC (GH32 family)